MRRLLAGLALCLTVLPSFAEVAGRVAALTGTAFVVTASGESREISNGDVLKVGEQLTVGPEGRLQVILRDETTFSLGPNAEFVLDEFVTGSERPSLKTSVSQGAFRFISGTTAKAGEDVMQVELPSGTIAVRGTQVAGIISETGDATVVLIGPGENSFGETPGAIEVSNPQGSEPIMRAGFATELAFGQPPTDAFRAPAELINTIEAATGQTLAEAVNEVLSLDDITVVAGADETGDGRADTINANRELADLLSSELGEGNDATSNSQVTEIMSLITTLPPERLQYIEWHPNMARIVREGAVSRGIDNATTLRSSALRGATTFRLDNVEFSGGCPTADCGAFSHVTTLNFDTDRINFAVDGNIAPVQIGATAADTLAADFQIRMDARFDEIIPPGSGLNVDPYLFWDGNAFFSSSLPSGFEGETVTAQSGRMTIQLNNVEITGTPATNHQVTLYTGAYLESLAVGGAEPNGPNLGAVQVGQWVYANGTFQRRTWGTGYGLAE